jgi:transposase
MVGPADLQNAGYAASTKQAAQSRMQEADPMKKVRFIGLDVHKDSIVIALAEGTEPPEVVATIPNEMGAVLKRLRRLAEGCEAHFCYEAGPTGFGLCRALRQVGLDCRVVAPSLVPQQASDRIKTDRRDAVKLARFLRSGDLTEVQVPDAATEAMRDLERAREDAKNSERAARHQLTKFLLRHDRKYSGKTSWTGMHLDWVRKQQFDHEAQNRVLVDYLQAVELATQRVDRLTKDIAELVEQWSLKPLVRALMGLRGVQLVSAVVLAAEVGDFQRFPTARALMAYLGLVPSEHSSGESRRRGRITKSGNGHARRILVESAWSYRFRPTMSREIRQRNAGLSPGVQAVAWKAQQRLNARYNKLLGRGKTKQQVVTALARELAGFVWCIARQPAAHAA